MSCGDKQWMRLTDALYNIVTAMASLMSRFANFTLVFSRQVIFFADE